MSKRKTVVWRLSISGHRIPQMIFYSEKALWNYYEENYSNDGEQHPHLYNFPPRVAKIEYKILEGC